MVMSCRGDIATQPAYGSINRRMIKKLKKRQSGDELSPKARLALLVILSLIGGVAIVIAVISIIIVPIVNPGSQRGIGANGFQAFVEDGGSLNVVNIVSKNDVAEALGNKAKSVSDVEVSKIFNIDGTRGQTATYNFVRANGLKASLYVDLMHFADLRTYESAGITANTKDAGKVNGNQAYYMHAMTFGSEREYRLMVVKGLKVYKFVISQPYRTISINEVSALATLRKLAEKAQL